MSTLGTRLKKARKNANLSLTDVEKRIDVSNAYLSQLENNKRNNPSMDLLKKLAKLYGVNLSYFVAPKQTIEALTDEEKEFFEEMLQNDQLKALLREARGLTPSDLARIIQIAKQWNDGEIPE